jgi:hypothetical protein
MPKKINQALAQVEKEKIDRKKLVAIDKIASLRSLIGDSLEFKIDHFGSTEFVDTLYSLLDFALLRSNHIRTTEGEAYFLQQLREINLYIDRCVTLSGVYDEMMRVAATGSLSGTMPEWVKRPKPSYTKV